MNDNAHYYEVKLDWKSDRKGLVSSPVLKSNIEVATPPGKYIISEIVLSPELTIKHINDNEKALRVLEKSEAACLISNSIKSKIIFKPVIHYNLVTQSGL
jgi:hypothetical protein